MLSTFLTPNLAALLLVLTVAAHTTAFAPTPLQSLTKIPSLSLDDESDPPAAASQPLEDETSIRTSYFLQSSGFVPSKSILSTLLDGESTSDSEAKQSMATLESSQRQLLLSRIHHIGEEYADHVQETTEEWNTEWEFRQIASNAAAEKVRMRQQGQLDNFLAMVRGSDEHSHRKSVEKRNGDNGRLVFGMPYGERKVKTLVKKIEEKEASPREVQVIEEAKIETPILSQIMEEKAKEIEHPVIDNQSSHDDNKNPDQDIKQASSSDTGMTETDESATDDKNTANDETKEGKEPIDNLSMLQDSAGTGSANEMLATEEVSEAEKKAAEQRKANAIAAQEKMDERVKQKIEQENKKKEEAKAKAEAILKQAEEDERLRIEKEEDTARMQAEKEAEAEAARLQAEQEAEASRLQAEQEAEVVRLQAEQEAEEVRLHAEQESEAEASRLQAEQEAEQERLRLEAIQQRIDAVESKMQPITDKATSVTFDAKLDDGLYLVGVGVRKKAIINVYSVAMYSSVSVLEAVSVYTKKQKQEAQMALRDAARSFDVLSPMTTFVLQMTFKADGKTIAGAIADSVKPRYGGQEANVRQLESLIFEGVRSKGGQATKGTIFRFDCSVNGVSVGVDGDEQGTVECETLGASFVDVFTDDKAVSPKLVDNCVDTWSGSGL